jgi:hypothetical protein
MKFKHILYLIFLLGLNVKAAAISKTIKMDSLHVSMDSAFALYSGNTGGLLSLVGASSTDGTAPEGFTVDLNEGDNLYLLVWDPGQFFGPLNMDSVVAVIGANGLSGMEGSTDGLTPIYRLQIGAAVPSVPEPGTSVLMALGLTGLAGFSLRRKSSGY